MAQTIALIEPFYGGSHRQLMDLLNRELGDDAMLFTMTDKKWPWRARCSALHFAEFIPKIHNYRVLFASSVLNLAELLGLRPDLSKCYKVLYFHENQLIYPVRLAKDRDFQFGYNQIISCMSADEILFNSSYNMESFLCSIATFLKLMPSHRPKGLAETIRPKCRVLYYPINFTITPDCCPNSPASAEPYSPLTDDTGVHPIISTPCPTLASSGTRVDSQDENPLHIIWPHRWEHDKNPEAFFSTLFELQSEQLPFVVSVLGQSYTELPSIFEEAKEKLSDKIIQWGFCQKRSDYVRLLQQADVVVSTAIHEFFGVAMLEATYHGCYPLCPNSLVYPEIFPDEHLYNTRSQLKKKLKAFCVRPHLARKFTTKINFDLYDWSHLKREYVDVFKEKL